MDGRAAQLAGLAAGVVWLECHHTSQGVVSKFGEGFVQLSIVLATVVQLCYDSNDLLLSVHDANQSWNRGGLHALQTSLARVCDRS